MELEPLLNDEVLSDDEDFDSGRPTTSSQFQQSKHLALADDDSPALNTVPDEEHVCTEGSDNNDNDRVLTGQLPVLPNGKEYHLFVCHSGADEDMVDTIVTSLEERGVKCMYSKRDFMAGQPIRSNIEEGIGKSLKMLVLLSSNMHNNGWYDMEIDVAIFGHVKGQNKGLIPVRLEDCQIPDSLRMYTYIDGINNPNVADEIIHYLCIPCSKKTAYLNGDEVKRTNGRAISVPYQLNEGQKRGGFFSSETLLGDLKGIELEIPNEVCEDLLELVNNSFVIRYNYLRSLGSWNMLRVLVYAFFVWIFGNLAILFSTALAIGLSYAGSVAGVSFSLSAVLYIAWSIICCFGARRVIEQATFNLRKQLWTEIIQPHYKTKKFIVQLYHFNQFYLHLRIVRYDTGPCRENLKKYIAENPVGQRLRKEDETVEETIERLMLHLIVNDAPNLLKYPTERILHNMNGYVKCICQIVISPSE